MYLNIGLSVVLAQVFINLHVLETTMKQGEIVCENENDFGSRPVRAFGTIGVEYSRSASSVLVM